jgi:hypothetical protein
MKRKSLSKIAKKIKAKRCEKKRNKWCVCFAKTCKNEAKQVAKIKKEQKRDTLPPTNGETAYWHFTTGEGEEPLKGQTGHMYIFSV